MPVRSKTTGLTKFRRPRPEAVVYDLSCLNVATITLPAHSTWTTGLHWHESHTEYLQIVQGRALVTLGNTTREYDAASGVIEVPRRTAHEWGRVPNDEGLEDVVVQEWTLPKDGAKEAFFRMLNSFLLEERPEKMYRPLPRPLSRYHAWVEKWTVPLQLYIIFNACDNYPVLVRTDAGWVSWFCTHMMLMLSVWIGGLLGLRGTYPEYVDGVSRKRAATVY